MKFSELITEHPVAQKRIVFCRPPTEKTFRNDRSAALSIEIQARARPKSNDILYSLVALLCVSIILDPLAALLLLNANLQNGFNQSAAASMSEVRRHTEVNPIGLVPSPRTFVLRNEAKTH
jgi:hypothetical protein